MTTSEFVWYPDKHTVETSNLADFMQRVSVRNYEDLCEKADQDPEWFWEQAISYGNVTMPTTCSNVLDKSAGIAWAKWFVGGKTNFTLECLEKHAHDPGREVIVAERENGEVERMTHAELVQQVAEFAGALKSAGVDAGDTVGIYMPMIPQVAVAFLAVARLGAVAVPLFSGFGPDAIITRLNDAAAKVLVTVDTFVRRGKEVDALPVLEEVRAKTPTLTTTIVLGEVRGKASHYQSWDELEQNSTPVLEAEIVDADAPLLLIYTSGTTGKPKGAVITHIGLAGKLIADIQLSLDLKPEDRWLWMSDFGWVIGPLYVGGSLMIGATLVMAEGAPNYPDPQRFWQLVDRHKVSFLGVAPTLIRAYIDDSDNPLESHSLDSIRVVVSSGEPWTTESWRWCFKNVCKERAPILNYSGGTEITGGILTCTVVQPQKPMAFSSTSLAMGAMVVNDVGEPLGADVIGELALGVPSIGLTKSLWGDDSRYLESYWSDFEDKWRHGDLVSRDKDGYWTIHGRSDDVLKIGGKRTGPSEIEDLVFATGLVDQVAAVGLPDERAGQVVACVVVPSEHVCSDEQLCKNITNAIVDGMGRPYKPQLILSVQDLPRTRSGKVVRRLIGAILANKPPGDMSTLDNPGALEAIQNVFKASVAEAGA